MAIKYRSAALAVSFFTPGEMFEEALKRTRYIAQSNR
jgi:hypothetical protein